MCTLSFFVPGFMIMSIPYVGLCNDIYMLGRVARIELSVSADIVCAARYLMQIGNLLEQLSLNIIH